MTEMLILAVHLPGTDAPVLGGFVLTAEGSPEPAVVFRPDWGNLCDPEDAEVLESMEATLQAIAAESKRTGRDFVALLEDRLSNTIRCLERLRIPSSKPLAELSKILATGLVDEPYEPISV
jgi:hypothetical protein